MRAAPTSGGGSKCQVDVKEGCVYVFWTNRHHRAFCVGGGGIQARLSTYKKVCVNLARER